MSLAEVDYLMLFPLLVMLITVGKLLNPHCLKNFTYYIIKKCGLNVAALQGF